MKINIKKIFLGSTNCSQQSSIWITIDNIINPPVIEGFDLGNNILDNIVKLYSFLQRQSKIIVENTYHQFDDMTIGISYSNMEAALITLQSIENICNGYPKELIIKNLESQLQQFSEPGQNSVYFLNDALEWRIPTCRFSNNGHYFGTGCFTQKLSSTSTKMTSVIGVNLAKNKLQTSLFLTQNGLPGSTHVLVNSLEEAINAANKIGYPIVIKPNDRDNGDGVFAGIKNEKNLRLFFEKTKSFSDNILIEKHINGYGHRITFCDNKIVAVTKKLPWGIVGDGQKMISQLVENFDDEMLSILEDENLTKNSILEVNRFLPLRRKNNASASGQTIGLNIKDVHPDNIQLAFTISKLFDLDIVGIDLIISDISKSWLENECVIPDINAIPQIGFDRVKTIFETLFPNEFRVPIYLLIIKDPLDLKLDKIKNMFNFNAYSTIDGVWINNKLISNRFNNGFDSARSMIFNSEVNSGLVVMTLDGIKIFGLPLDKFNVVVLDNVDLDEDSKKVLLGQNIIRINE